MTTQANLPNRADVVSFLKSQHQQIQSMFGAVLNAKGAEKVTAYAKLKALMTAHEKGEQAIVHPVSAATIPRGDLIVSDRLHEESMAKRAIAVLDFLDIHTAEFDDKLRVLQNDVAKHADSEESQELGKLALVVDQARLEQMLKALEAVEIEAIRGN